MRLALLLCVLPVLAQAKDWTIGPETSVRVEAKWNGSTVNIRFPTLRGRIAFDETDIAGTTATIEVATGDATTGVGLVDRLVRSADYLGAERYPTITFHLDRLVQTSKSTADVSGRITLRDVTRPAAFKAVVIRYGPDPADPATFQAGFDISGQIDRTAFGSTGGLPDVAAVLPVRIRLMMSAP